MKGIDNCVEFNFNLFTESSSTISQTTDMEEMGVAESTLQPIRKDSECERKRRRQHGEEYVTRKGVLSRERQFKFVNCKCRNECVQLDEDERRNIFSAFWGLTNWNSQTVFLKSCMQSVSIIEFQNT